MSNNTVPQETLDKLQEILYVFFYHWYNSPGTNTVQGAKDWLKTDEAQSLIQSLFSPAQPTDDRPDMDILKEGDALLTERKKHPNHITKQLNREEEISYNSGFHEGYVLGYKANQEAIRGLQGDLSAWDIMVLKEKSEKLFDKHSQTYDDLAGTYVMTYEDFEKAMEDIFKSQPAKEPAPTDWEKDFTRFLSEDCSIYVSFEILNDIIDFIKQRVPKTVVAGMRWVKASEKIPWKDGLYSGKYNERPVLLIIENRQLVFLLNDDGTYFRNEIEKVHFDILYWLDESESPSLSSLIEQVRTENPYEPPATFENRERESASYGWNAALDKLIDKLK